MWNPRACKGRGGPASGRWHTPVYTCASFLRPGAWSVCTHALRVFWSASVSAPSRSLRPLSPGVRGHFCDLPALLPPPTAPGGPHLSTRRVSRVGAPKPRLPLPHAGGLRAVEGVKEPRARDGASRPFPVYGVQAPGPGREPGPLQPQAPPACPPARPVRVPPLAGAPGLSHPARDAPPAPSHMTPPPPQTFSSPSCRGSKGMENGGLGAEFPARPAAAAAALPAVALAAAP